MSATELLLSHQQTEAAGPAEIAQTCLYYMHMMREVEDRIERKL